MAPAFLQKEVPPQPQAQTLFRRRFAAVATVDGNDGNADDRIAKETLAKVTAEILDVSEFGTDDLVVWMKRLGSVCVVIVGEIDHDLKNAGTTLTEVSMDFVMGFDKQSLHEAIVETVKVFDSTAGFFRGGNLKLLLPAA